MRNAVQEMSTASIFYSHFVSKYKQERKKLTVSCLAGGGSNEQAGS